MKTVRRTGARRKTTRHHRREDRYEDRLSRFFRDSLESDFARDALGRVKAFIIEKPVLSTCLGLAAGLLLGMVVRRRT